jgi:hypothetical protein
MSRWLLSPGWGRWLPRRGLHRLIRLSLARFLGNRLAGSQLRFRLF